MLANISTLHIVFTMTLKAEKIDLTIYALGRSSSISTFPYLSNGYSSAALRLVTTSRKTQSTKLQTLG